MSSSQPWGQLTAQHWEGLLSEGQHLPLSVPGGMALGSLATGIQPRQRPAIF